MKPPAQIPEAYLIDLQGLIKTTPKEGSIVELGVYKGGSAWMFNEVADGRALHLFDTFSGIPEASPGDAFAVGAFADVNVEDVRAALPSAALYVGIFPSTWPADFGDISFAHIDCDQYATCKAAIERFWPKVLPGGIMAWDDYCFPGINKAVHEFFTQEQMKFTELKIPYVVKGAE